MPKRQINPPPTSEWVARVGRQTAPVTNLARAIRLASETGKNVTFRPAGIR